MPVPVHVVAGFLGTGKTTLLLDQLARRRGRERVAIVVNDFGEAGIDEALVGADSVGIAEIPGACVCCTAPEGFTDALGNLLDTVRPDRIFIEPTGLARPADLVDTIRRGPHRDRLDVGPVVVLVDPGSLRPGAVGAPLVREQLEAADVLVANRSDLCSAEELAALDEVVAALWPGPLRVVRTAYGVVDEVVFDWPEGAGPRAIAARHDHDHHHDHHHDAHSTAGFTARTWVWPPEVVFSRERLVDCLAKAVAGAAGAPLARLKGLFRTEEGVFLVQVAGGRVDERASEHRRDSRVDVILATESEAPVEALGDWLSAARLSASERDVDARRLEVVLPDGRRPVLDRAALAALPGGVPDVGALVAGRHGEAARVAALFEALGAPWQGEVRVIAADGYATPAVPASALRAALLVHSLDGAALPDALGGPFRLLIPGDAGPGGPCANVKGAVRLVLR